MSAVEVAEHPRITLSTLARAMGPITSDRLGRLLRGHKYRRPGPIRSYQNARRQGILHLTARAPLDPDAPLRSHEREAVHALARMRLPLPEEVRATRPATHAPAWEVEGVTISMEPDVELEDERSAGALKLVLTKELLPDGVGSRMAALLWHHRRNVLGIARTERRHCIVFEPRRPWLHLPDARPSAQVRPVELACRIIGAVWPLL